MTRRRNWIAVFAVGAMLSGSFVQADESAVYFPTGSSQLSAKSKAALKKLTSSSGGLKLHASSEPRGSEDVNARLREERVRSVREFLVSIGVAESQIQSDGGAAGDGPPSAPVHHPAPSRDLRHPRQVAQDASGRHPRSDHVHIHQLESRSHA